MITLNVRLFLALFFAFVFTILPLPDLLIEFRPPWVLLLVLYVQLFLPNYFSITLLFFIGLCLDVLLSTVIGEHAFALLLTTWFVMGKARRFNFFSLLQQMILVALFCLSYQLIIYFIESFLGYHNNLRGIVGAAVFGMLLWPWMRVLGDRILFGYVENP